MSKRLSFRSVVRISWVMAITGLIPSPAAFALGDQPAWITKSNANAQVLVETVTKLSPEFAGRMGVQGYDDKILDLTAGVSERTRTLFTAARDELVKRATTETDPSCIRI